MAKPLQTLIVLRAERNLSQRDLAEKIRMSKHRYWEIERGYRDPSEDEIKSIARALKCAAVDIIPAEQAAHS